MTASPLVLIVDDSRTSRMLISGFIKQLRPDWRIVEADSGDAALVVLETEVPTYLSMDDNMPGMRGLEAAGRVRILHPEVRIVMCSANIQESMRNSAAQSGIGFVAKPINERSVRESIALWEAV
jgi:two-component system chemotaxis response regulator CheY